VRGGEGPCEAVPFKSSLNLGITSDIEVVIVIDEGITGDLPVRSDNQGGDAEGDQPFASRGKAAGFLSSELRTPPGQSEQPSIKFYRYACGKRTGEGLKTRWGNTGA
jgi:hypothetical protein